MNVDSENSESCAKCGKPKAIGIDCQWCQMMGLRAANPYHLNTERILFHVHRDRSVDLCLGPLSVTVCGKPEEFQVFVDDLHRKLTVIAKEISDEWCED